MSYWKTETKEISRKFGGKEEKLTIKKLNAGDEADVTNLSTELITVGKVQRGKMFVGNVRLLRIWKGIVHAPFPYKVLDDIREIPKDVSDWIYEELNKINGFDVEEGPEKKGKSSGPSTMEQPTPGSE